MKSWTGVKEPGPNTEGKNKLRQEKLENPDDPACTSVPRSTIANGDQPTEERKGARLHAANRKNQTQMHAAQLNDRYGMHKILRDGGEEAHGMNNVRTDQTF